jgi:hypothetical protein
MYLGFTQHYSTLAPASDDRLVLLNNESIGRSSTFAPRRCTLKVFPTESWDEGRGRIFNFGIWVKPLWHAEREFVLASTLNDKITTIVSGFVD